ncbi:MAG: histidine kinase [Geobacteraceae bacterium GWC2_58_44]|nr:MAG: histidine kinase [Geobacteraceae bacterium GWC2_58_44]HBG05385.1 histidine kinase [Geobacter sp.]
MTRFIDLPIRIKFFGLMSLLLLVLLVATGIFTYQRQESFILKFAVDNARSFASQLIETRDYMSSVVKGEPEHNYNLVPQVVATQVARRVTQNSKFYVRQVSLRYRNPENRPDQYETAQLKAFAQNPTREVYDIVESDDTRSFRYMQPMLATASCLECHGTYESAPNFVKQRFPPGHFSYNYQVGEVIGAVSVTIPMKDLYAQLGANLQFDMIARGLVFLIVILVMAILMSRQVIDPVKRVSERIIRVTRTGDFHEKLPQKTHDEIGSLIGAFNDLMEELARKTLQSKESDERYRRFIELSGSAVVTFLKDGKIVIANQKAETLFGRSRQSLLGESIFSFLENGSALQEKLGTGEDAKEESSRQRVRGAGGKTKEVEMVISASKTDREPMFTAILREDRAPSS